MPSSVLTRMSLNLVSMFPIKASIIALEGAGVNFLGTGIASPPSISANSSKSTNSGTSTPIGSTGRGGSPLWLWVYGIRSTRAASAVTAGSGKNLWRPQ